MGEDGSHRIRAEPWEWGLLGVVVVFLIALYVTLYVPRYQERQRTQQFKADAEQAIITLEKVAAAVEVGVRRTEYSSRLVDAKAEVGRFLSRWPDARIRSQRADSLKRTVTRALNEFVEAGSTWDVLNRAREDYEYSERSGFYSRIAISIDGKTLTEEEALERDRQTVHFWQDSLNKEWARAVDLVKEARKQVNEY